MKSTERNLSREAFGWNAYQKVFLTITTQFQRETYRETMQHLRGDVVDLGCGTAKLAPLINGKVDRYTGVDSSPMMLRAARHMVTLLPTTCTQYEFVKASVDKLPFINRFSAATSINSYYAWERPQECLHSIFQCLEPGALFVLATPNARLNMDDLLAEAEKELLTHPHWREFKARNVHLSELANLKSLDALIGDVRSCNFEVLEAHDRHFKGGLNFLVLRARK